MKTRLAVLALLLLPVVACAPQIPPEGVTAQTLVTGTATVLEVDPPARLLRLRDEADGTEYALRAELSEAELSRLAPGDTIMLDYFRSTTLAIAPADDPGAPIAVRGEAPSAIGARPGGVTAGATSIVAEVIAFDPILGILTILPEGAGAPSRVAVPEDLIGPAAGLAPGTRIALTVTEAVAVSATPPRDRLLTR